MEKIRFLPYLHRRRTSVNYIYDYRGNYNTTIWFDRKEKKEEDTYQKGISITKDPRGFPLITEVTIEQPDKITVTQYYKNSKAVELRAVFIPNSQVIFEREAINQADIHSPNSHVLDTLVGVTSWSWKPNEMEIS